jgi:hypothetical protein
MGPLRYGLLVVLLLNGIGFADTLSTINPLRQDHRTITSDLYSVIQTFVGIYGAADFTPILTDSEYTAAIKLGQNNVPRSLAATAVVFAFVGAKEGDRFYRERAIELMHDVTDKYPRWRASLLPPEESFNLAPTTGFNLGLAAWLLWDTLDAGFRATVRQILTEESDFQLLRKPASGYVKDTKAEENCIVPALLAISSILNADNPNKTRWGDQAQCFAYHTITTEDDSARCGLKTITTYPDFTMDNHNFGPHPVYMAAPLVHFADAALVYRAAGKPLPGEYLHNVIPLWNRLKDFLADDFTWTTRNSWEPTGLSREVSAATFMTIVAGIDSAYEARLIDYKCTHQSDIVEKKVEQAKRISQYTADWFNNCIVAKRYVVAYLLHDPGLLMKQHTLMKE